MKNTVVFCFLASALAFAPFGVSAQQSGGGDVIEFVCRDAGLGKYGVVAKKLRNSLRAAAATAGISNAAIKIKSVVDVERPTIQVSRAELNAGDIPVTFAATPLSFDFGDATVSVVSPNDQACNVTRDFTIEIKRRTGEIATDVVRVMSPGKYFRKRPTTPPPG